MNLLTYLDGTIDQSGKTFLYDIYSGIGDNLWRTTLFREIKRRNPKLKLIVTAKGNSWKFVFKNNPYIDELRDLDQNGQLYLDDVDYFVDDKICPHVVA